MYGKPDYDDGDEDLRQMERATLVRISAVLALLLLGAAFPKMLAGICGGALWIVFSVVGWALP